MNITVSIRFVDKFTPIGENAKHKRQGIFLFAFAVGDSCQSSVCECEV